MLIIACVQANALPTLQVNNNIPGVSIQFRMKGHNLPGVCNAMIANFIPTTGLMTWNFATPGIAPLVWVPPYAGAPFSYDAIYWEVVGMGGVVLCSGTTGEFACGYLKSTPIPCIAGVHTVNWNKLASGNVTVNFN